MSLFRLLPIMASVRQATSGAISTGWSLLAMTGLISLSEGIVIVKKPSMRVIASLSKYQKVMQSHRSDCFGCNDKAAMTR